MDVALESKQTLRPIWLDCDPGHDDAIAILLSLRLSGLVLLGISTVGSNANVSDTTKNAARLVHAFGGRTREVDKMLGTDFPLKVYSGSEKPLLRAARHDFEIHGKDGLGGVVGLANHELAEVKNIIHEEPETGSQPPTNVTERIKMAIYKARDLGLGDLTVILTGGMTNMALFILSYPALIGVGNGIKEIIFMGGAIGVGNRGPTSEYNVLFDPEAAKIVCNCRCKVVMIPLNVTHTAIWHQRLHEFLINPQEYAATRGSKELSASKATLPVALTPLRYTLSTLFEFFKATYLKTFGFENGPPIHDALCLVYLFDHSVFKTKLSKVEIECASNWCDGTTVVDVWGDRDHEFHNQNVESGDWSGSAGKNVFVAESMDIPRCWNIILQAIYETDLISPLNQETDVSNLILNGSGWIEPPDDVVTPYF